MLTNPPSKGLLRDYKPSDGPSFESLVRMGAPYAVFLMRSVNTVNLDPAIFEGPKYPPELNENWKQLTGPNGNFTGPRHGQYVPPVLVIYLSAKQTCRSCCLLVSQSAGMLKLVTE